MNDPVDELIVFLLPPEKFISGGIISIFDICSETRSLASNSCATIMAVYPGESSYGRYDFMDNDEVIYEFSTIFDHFPRLNSIIIHIPEYSVERVFWGLSSYGSYLNSIDNFQINILNQNIEMMPNESAVASLLTLTSKVTQTTAFSKYTDQSLADRYGVSAHFLSVGTRADSFTWRTFNEKENIVAISPDEHPLRSSLIEQIRSRTKFEVVEIVDLKFEEYKDLVSRAKFTISFGEGMDGYFTESMYSGSIGISFYNETFFPRADYLSLENVYKDSLEMVNCVIDDMTRLDSNPDIYGEVNRRAVDKIKEDYSDVEYRNNLLEFYRNNFSYSPSVESRIEFLLTAIMQKDARYRDVLNDFESVKQEMERSSEEETRNAAKEILFRSSNVEDAMLDIFEALTREISDLKSQFETNYHEMEELRNSPILRFSQSVRGVSESLRRRIGRLRGQYLT